MNKRKVHEKRTFQKILEVLEKNPRGLSFRQIGFQINKAPATIAKYCMILRERGNVTIEQYGMTKIVKLVKK